MASNGGARRIAFSRWLAGLVIGVSGGFLVLVFPTLGMVVIGLGVVGVLGAGERVAGGSGLLIGIGAIITALLARAQMACQAFDAVPNQGCEAPDVTSYLVLAGAMLVVGVLGSLMVLRRRGSRRAP